MVTLDFIKVFLLTTKDTQDNEKSGQITWMEGDSGDREMAQGLRAFVDRTELGSQHPLERLITLSL